MHNALAGETRSISEPFGLVEHIELVFRRLFKGVESVLDNNMACRAGAIAAAVVIDQNVVIERGIEYRGTFVDIYDRLGR